MGIMNRMRENTAVVLYILVFAFGGLWVLQDSGAFDTIGMQTSRHVARVNGEPIDVSGVLPPHVMTCLREYYQAREAS